MKILTKDDIFTADDAKLEVVEVPEWGGTINIIGISGLERDAFEQEIVTSKTEGARLQNFRARYLVKCIVDDDKKRMFKDTDAVSLGNKNGAVIGRLFDVARKLSGMDDAATETALKNSQPTQEEDSI